jgi:hypothetical protein
VSRFRLWRVRRAYRTIAKLELKISDKEVLDLRRDFANETLTFVDRWQRHQGWTRGQRRNFKRTIVRGHE